MLKLRAFLSKRSKPDSPELNLISASQNLINLLEQVDRYPCLYLNKPILRNAIRRYEHVWPRVVASAPLDKAPRLLPPLDVEWVWLLHMFCPEKYCSDSRAMYATSNPGKEPAILDHFLLSGDAREEALRDTEDIWKKVVPKEPFHVLDLLKRSPCRDDGDSITETLQPEVPSCITYDIIEASAREMSFLYQVSLPHYRKESFLSHAVKRYKNQFLKLHTLFPNQVWAPSLDIDLVWHAHMAHPSIYCSDTTNWTGRLILNDNTLKERPSRFMPDVFLQKTDLKWLDIFGQSMLLPGCAWRGHASSEEYSAHPSIQQAIHDLETQLKGYRRNMKDIDAKKIIVREEEINMNGNREMKDNKAMEITVRDDVVQTAFSGIPQFEGWVHKSWDKAMQSLSADKERNDFSYFERWSRCGESPLFLNRAMLTFRKHKGVAVDSWCALEVFRGAKDAVDLGFPIATVHTPPPMSTPTFRERMHKPDARISEETILVLRIGGEDFAILSGIWVSPILIENQLAISSCEQAYLSMHIMYTGRESLKTWVPLHQSMLVHKYNGVRSDRLCYQLPSRTWPDRIAGSFDLLEGRVITCSPKQMLPTYLVCMSAAMLHVTSQARHTSTDTVQSMYPFITNTQGEEFRGREIRGPTKSVKREFAKDVFQGVGQALKTSKSILGEIALAVATLGDGEVRVGN